MKFDKLELHLFLLKVMAENHELPVEMTAPHVEPNFYILYIITDFFTYIVLLPETKY